MKQRFKKKVMIAATLGMLFQSTSGFAEVMPEFSLGETLVTALRVESKDLDTPAYVHVYTQEQLQNTGGVNVLEAVRFTEGIVYSSLGAGGQSYDTMTSKAVIRGSEKGTLVLINGIKMTMDGYYNLEDIPLQNVERVEIVKGAASVLYGNDAFAGVINIILKKNAANSITVSQGSFGQQNHSLSLQEDKFSLIGVVQKLDEVRKLSRSGYGMGDLDKKSVQWQYKLNDQLTFSHSHMENQYSFDKYAGTEPNINWDQKATTYQYDDVKDFVRLRYDSEKWDINLYSNFQDRQYEKYTGLNTASPTHSNSQDYKFVQYGVDTQTNWKNSVADFIGGFGYYQERYRKDITLPTASVLNVHRDGYSVFLQGTKKISDDTTLIVGARQEYVVASNETFSAFCPQFQAVKKLTDSKSWYVNTGKSFKMPEFTQLYNSAGLLTGSNENLRPEDGWNYETGMKWQGKDSTLKAAIYHMDYNSITYTKIKVDGEDYSVPKNLPFRNTGVEVSYQKKLSPAFTYTVGASYSNPELYKDNNWEAKYGRLQFNTILQYQQDRWSANLSATYFGDRVYDYKPQFPVNITTGYRIDQNKTVKLAILNVLDRKDITTHSGAPYYALPRGYQLSYTQLF